MLDKSYDHKKIEAGKYDFWNKSGYFLAGVDKTRPPFSMVIPPPNVTGKLHLGHAWDNTLQDIIARYKRMCGYDVLYLPGTDHAGIATQAKVEGILQKQGIYREDLGREGLLKKIWEWKDEYCSIIHNQFAKMGISVDYTRERFTLDEGLSKAVRKVFVEYYNKGLIYRGERIINYDPVLKTALSNIEVIYKEDKGKMYYFRYPIVGSDESIVVGTTRPETMFGDVAIVVNPKDKRYAHLVGKQVINPANEEPLIIIADEYVDMDFATGAMKCTPAHDPNDFLLGEKYHLPRILCLDSSAKMTEKAGIYQGLNRYECRDLLVKKIEQDGRLVKIEDIVHQVGHSERSDAVIEPMVSKQWFVKIKPLAKQALDKSTVKFFPTRFQKVFHSWMNNADDWCISRQLWWGHRIPAWYDKEGNVYVSETDLTDPNLTQDEDVLDTWFSSALWPFSTMGWPDMTEDYKRYYPTSALVTGYDIIFFWVSRMIFQGLELTGKSPFEHCLIHGLIRDPHGKKMTKSAGNGVDPIDVIEKYGVDALRVFLTSGSAPGQDIRYNEDRLASARAFLNKVWNSARYVLSLVDTNYFVDDLSGLKLDALNKDILNKYNIALTKITRFMNRYEFASAMNIINNFVYDEFCSNYLEMSKVSLMSDDKNKQIATKATLAFLIKNIVLLIYPYAPFISEEIYQNMPNHRPSIMEETYPKKAKFRNSRKENEQVAVLYDFLSFVRNYKSEKHLAPNAAIEIAIHTDKELFPEFITCLQRYSFATSILINQTIDDREVQKYSRGDCTLYLFVKEDAEALQKEIARLKAEIMRSEKMLTNPQFLAKAPSEKIKLEKEKYTRYQKSLEAILKK